MSEPRRSTSRLARELPVELREELHKKLVENHATLDEVTEWLGELGFDFSRSAVGRYSQGFLGRLERLKLVREQARSIVDAGAGRPALELSHAASEIALELVTKKLMDTPDLEGADIVDILNVLTKLQDSTVRREALKAQFDKGVTAAEDRITSRLKKELGKDKELLGRVIGLAKAAADEARRAA